MKQIFFTLFFLTARILLSQDVVDRLTVPFSSPDKEGFVSIDLVNGSITVEGYNGKEVQIEARPRLEKVETESTKNGMRRISFDATGLEVEEDDNKMEIDVESWKRTIDLQVKVPVLCSLKLTCVNNGDITVKNIKGEIEVENINGKVTMTDISGAVTAHSLNKQLNVIMTNVQKDKSMSFSTLNGDIDVTLPASTRANVRIKSENGDIYSDFDMEQIERPKETIEESKDTGGKYKIKIDRSLILKINGGGPEIMFSSFQGDIYIRKQQ
ncbi:DUF4097 family beta strand repeat protein [candidate division KSB1 bacterium]|nr:DUF4097 family beta strand repeat protein [candidate division KSB1 bacterium]